MRPRATYITVSFGNNLFVVDHWLNGNLYPVDMAIGLSNHLKIRDLPAQERTVNDVATIRTFWSLFFLDRFVHLSQLYLKKLM